MEVTERFGWWGMSLHYFLVAKAWYLSGRGPTEQIGRRDYGYLRPTVRMC
jgi:hypothetical protein